MDWRIRLQILRPSRSFATVAARSADFSVQRSKFKVLSEEMIFNE